MERLGKSGFPVCWLAICLMVGGLWWRSYGRADVVFAYLWGGRVQTISSAKGAVGISISNLACGQQRAFTVDWIGSDLVEWRDLMDRQGNAFPIATHGTDLLAAGLSLGWEGGSGFPGVVHRWWRMSYTTRRPPQLPSATSVFWSEGVAVPGAWQASAVVPHWLVLALGGVPLLKSVHRWQRARRRRRQGRCVQCGYDLRATPVRCPECGREVAELASAPDSTRRWLLPACALGGAITLAYACVAWPGWSGGPDGGKPGESGVLIRMHDVSDLAPPLEKREDQLRTRMSYFSTGLFDPVREERSWRIVDCNLAARELDRTVRGAAQDQSTSSHICTYGGRLTVVGTEESQRRVLSVLCFVREQIAVPDEAAKGARP